MVALLTADASFDSSAADPRGSTSSDCPPTPLSSTPTKESGSSPNSALPTDPHTTATSCVSPSSMPSRPSAPTARTCAVASPTRLYPPFCPNYAIIYAVLFRFEKPALFLKDPQLIPQCGVRTLLGLRLQLDPFAGDHEVATPKVMKRPWILHRRVTPRFDDFEDEKAVLVHHPGVDHPAFEIRKAFFDERRAD